MQGLLPLAAAAVTGILVGAATVATRFVIDQTDPASLALLRYVIGTLCLAPAVLMSSGIRFRRRDIVPIGLLGIGQFGILIALLNFGLQYIGAAPAALIFATVPLLTMVLAAGLGHESLSWFKTAGVLLTILGVGLALSPKLALAGGGWIGEVAVFGSAVCGAVCSVLYRPYLRRYPALQVGAFAMLASVLFLAGLAAWEGFFAALPRFTAGGWLAVLFIGLSSALGYYLWLWALQHTTATRVTVFLALGPITATALGGVFLSEAISAAFVLGLGCVVLGLWLAHRRPEPGPGA